MIAQLELSAVKALAAERAKDLDHDVTPDLVHVYEEAHSHEENTLVVQIAARRPIDRANWIRQRSRFSQSLRDALVERGDERYPLIEIFEPEEWPARDDRA